MLVPDAGDPEDSGTVTCPGGRFVIVDPGDLATNTGGLILDTTTGLTWDRFTGTASSPPPNLCSSAAGGCAQPDAVAYCGSKGARLPTMAECEAILRGLDV